MDIGAEKPPPQSPAPSRVRLSAARWSSAALVLMGTLSFAVGLLWRAKLVGRAADNAGPVTVSEHVVATPLDAVYVPIAGSAKPPNPETEILLKIPADIFRRLRVRLGPDAPPVPPQFDAILFDSGFDLESTNPHEAPSVRIGLKKLKAKWSNSIHQTANERSGASNRVSGFVQTDVMSGRRCRVYFDAIANTKEIDGELQPVDAEVTWSGPFESTDPPPYPSRRD